MMGIAKEPKHWFQFKNSAMHSAKPMATETIRVSMFCFEGNKNKVFSFTLSVPEWHHVSGWISWDFMGWILISHGESKLLTITHHVCFLFFFVVTQFIHYLGWVDSRNSNP